MNNSKMLLAFILCAGFNVLHADSDMLEKVKIAQKINAAFPRAVAITTSALKGIALHSQEKDNVKHCIMFAATLFEDAQDITTEERAQRFAIRLNAKITECCKVITVENLDINTNEMLPIIQIPQQIIAAFPAELAAIVSVITMKVTQESATQDDRKKAFFIFSSIQKLLDITTEEEAQNFVEELKAEAVKFTK